MTDPIRVGDRVRIRLGSEFWRSAGWHTGTVVRIDPYTRYRGFYWVELDVDVRAASGGSAALISVLNPRNIEKL